MVLFTKDYFFVLYHYICVRCNSVLQTAILIFVRVGMERQIYNKRGRIFAVCVLLPDVACILVEYAQSSGSLLRSVFMQLSLNIDKCVTVVLFATLLALAEVTLGTF